MIRRWWLELSWNCLLRSAELGCKGKLFACHCWSLKDCCWLILVSVAGGCSPCLCFILQRLIIQGHRRVEALLSLHGLHVNFGPIKEINHKKHPGQHTQLSPTVRAIRCSPPIALPLQRSASEVCRLTVARDASLVCVQPFCKTLDFWTAGFQMSFLAMTLLSLKLYWQVRVWPSCSSFFLFNFCVSGLLKDLSL